ncbi:ribonuclease M5 [Loigolactobacillus backii]|uniref:ribonuclease M5 n=1 Tax=Loigolactobacillus backii TaxID=375175 RepID=UPI0007F10D7E|nr:ribonuclease M5 [Loigolactobacillus backii]ANK60263.1 ribonuclease M5 [Loigolactobacillus backii]ANK65145.1 ribonuclease M5 [Loigolactobacillus backii]ANK67704.1 ribonuclease M5 [Loigolactobacillus backii]OLF70183.1 DNA primase [Loigolactobacillus backii]PIO87070.1 ribonuclease M5 [Loigolactobacillus backii]
MVEEKIKEIIVVEGRDDTRRLQQVVNSDTIETNGSEISDATLTAIATAQKRRGVIVFTDPDSPGEKIRKTISAQVPGIKHAFLSQGQAQPEKHKSSLGVEHAGNKAIKHALAHLYTQMPTTAKPIISRQVLQAMGLTAGPNAKDRRQRLGNILQIGYTNSKQLYKRLQLFQISEAEFAAAMKQVQKDSDLSEQK